MQNIRQPPEFDQGFDFTKSVFYLCDKERVLSEGLNEGLNEGLKSLHIAISSNVGIKAKDLVVVLNNRPLKTIERQIKDLIELNLIERRGSRKDGGYWLSNEDGEKKRIIK